MSPARHHGLDAVFRPRSVAVIGASRDRGTIGGAIFHNLIAHEFQGAVIPVNPNAGVVQSVIAYPSVEAIPGPVDLAVIVVPAAYTLAVLEQCGRKGVQAAIVISAGFKETGAEGAAREQALVECARRHRLRLVGPNCLGVLNTEPSVRLDATFAPSYPPPGNIAFSSQSGALGLAILEYAKDLNLGISHFISVGNKADVSGNDLLEFWEDDPRTDVILLYLESFGNPRRFTQIARRVGRRKPIIAVKSGRTSAGARAAASHTGSLAGTEAAVGALMQQSGVIRTDTIEELFDASMLLASQPLPAGPRVGIVTNAGGPGIMASDACESHGLILPSLDPGTVAALRAFLPPEASTRNPVDMIASATAESYQRAVRLVLLDPNIDALLAIFVPPIVTHAVEVARAIVAGAALGASGDGHAGIAKPVMTCFMGSHGQLEELRSLGEGTSLRTLSRSRRPWPSRAWFAMRSGGRRRRDGAHLRRLRRETGARRDRGRAQPRARRRTALAHARGGARAAGSLRRALSQDGGGADRRPGRRDRPHARLPGRAQAGVANSHPQVGGGRRGARPAARGGRAPRLRGDARPLGRGRPRARDGRRPGAADGD